MPLTRRSSLWFLAALALVAGVAVLALWPRISARASEQPGRSLAAFDSDDELRAFLRRLAKRQAEQLDVFDVEEPTASPPLAAMAPPVEEPAPETITNNQEAGVDEGGIVKPWRDMLVILRRGRLFTVSLSGASMRPVDAIDAFPPGVIGRGDWYDELLVAGDRIVVIGYSYARGGTEVNRFRIAPDGQLTFEDAYHLRSDDYYSSGNYASRLIGDRLVYYAPLYLGAAETDPLVVLPGVRKWEQGGSTGPFRRIADARHVYIAPRLKDHPDESLEALHNVVSCDLTAPELDCDATAVLGPASRTFYVSGTAVYLFVSTSAGSGYVSSHAANGRPGAESYIYRLPFDTAERPSAIGARGAPIDQFSFHEDSAAGRLDVMLQRDGSGDAMWGPERADGSQPDLLQVPLSAFGDGSAEAERSFYRSLPPLPASSYDLHNRFVGNHLLYGAGGGAAERGSGGVLVAAPIAGGGAFTLPLPHEVSRIEAMGRDAVVIGGVGRDLGFTAIHLGGGEPRIGERYIQRAASQGESRSHAFFFSPDAGSSGGSSGTIGLPVSRPAPDRYRHYFGSSAAMLFLRRESRSFRPAGELAARVEGTLDDACQASCLDWYGNARPIFLRGRIFALLGYELVEAQMQGGRIREVRRVSFAPATISVGGE